MLRPVRMNPLFLGFNQLLLGFRKTIMKGLLGFRKTIIWAQFFLPEFWVQALFQVRQALFQSGSRSGNAFHSVMSFGFGLWSFEYFFHTLPQRWFWYPRVKTDTFDGAGQTSCTLLLPFTAFILRQDLSSIWILQSLVYYLELADNMRYINGFKFFTFFSIFVISRCTTRFRE